jgi:hypothetical protein
MSSVYSMEASPLIERANALHQRGIDELKACTLLQDRAEQMAMLKQHEATVAEEAALRREIEKYRLG